MLTIAADKPTRQTPRFKNQIEVNLYFSLCTDTMRMMLNRLINIKDPGKTEEERERLFRQLMGNITKAYNDGLTITTHLSEHSGRK